MRVAVVGAGLAGLFAARELRGAGHEVIVVEKSRGVGGRLASRRVAGHRGRPRQPRAWRRRPARTCTTAVADLAGPQVRDTPDGLVDPAGATRLPKLLADGLDLRRGVRLAALRGGSAGIELGDEQGNTHGLVDAVVVTAPAPQAADLLERSPEAGDRVDALREAGLRSRRDGPPRHPGHRFRRPGVAPVHRARGRGAPRGGQGPAAGRRRRGGRGPDRPRGRGATCWTPPTRTCSPGSLPALGERLGLAGAPPAWAQVKRWRYAVPRGRVDDARVNPPGARIVVAGDAAHRRVVRRARPPPRRDSGVLAARRVGALAPVAGR